MNGKLATQHITRLPAANLSYYTDLLLPEWKTRRRKFTNLLPGINATFGTKIYDFRVTCSRSARGDGNPPSGLPKPNPSVSVLDTFVLHAR